MRCLVKLAVPVIGLLLVMGLLLAFLGSVLDGLPRSLPGLGGDPEARVVRVVDGDTLVVDVGGERERVRVLGIDTPETGAGGRARECGGRSASRSARRWVARTNDRVELERPGGTPNRDRYDRLLRTVDQADGQDGGLSSWQVDRGWARVYRRADLPQRQIEVLQARELRARVARRGAWRACATF